MEECKYYQEWWELWCGLQNIKRPLISAPVMHASDWTQVSHCYSDARQLSVWQTLSKIGQNRHEHIISYFAEQVSATEGELFGERMRATGLRILFRQFRCSSEWIEFDVLTENQVIGLFSKPHLRRHDERCLEYFRQFEISQPTLVKERAHALGKVPSEIPHDGIKEARVESIHAVAPRIKLREGLT